MSILICFCFFFKQKTAYEMRISDWSSDVCSSDLIHSDGHRPMLRDVFYYITVMNENYAQPDLPEGVEEDIVRGGYRYAGYQAKTGVAAEEIGRASCRERVCQYV